MPEQSLRRIRGVPRASDVNRLVAAIEAASRFTVGGAGTDMGLPGGRIVRFDQGCPIYGQVASGSNPYAVNFVAPKVGGGWAVLAPGGTAYEIQGFTDVPAGRVVELLPGFQDEWRFQDVRLGGCRVTITVKCGTAAAPGESVTLSNGSGGSASGTTDASGNVVFDLSALGGPGTYTVTINDSTCNNPSNNYALTCGGTLTLNLCPCQVPSGCNVPCQVTLTVAPPDSRAGSYPMYYGQGCNAPTCSWSTGCISTWSIPSKVEWLSPNQLSFTNCACTNESAILARTVSCGSVVFSNGFSTFTVSS